MKKIFTCTLICFFGFYLPGKTQVHSDHTIYTETYEHGLSIQQVGRLNTFKVNNQIKNYFTSYPVLVNACNSNTSPNVMAAPDNVFKRWLTDGSIQTHGEMTIAFSSFTINSVDNISILFSLPLKKFNL